MMIDEKSLKILTNFYQVYHMESAVYCEQFESNNFSNKKFWLQVIFFQRMHCYLKNRRTV